MLGTEFVSSAKKKKNKTVIALLLLTVEPSFSPQLDCFTDLILDKFIVSEKFCLYTLMSFKLCIHLFLIMEVCVSAYEFVHVSAGK